MWETKINPSFDLSHPVLHIQHCVKGSSSSMAHFKYWLRLYSSQTEWPACHRIPSKITESLLGDSLFGPAVAF
jgi:hypothetical protein